MSDRDVGEVRVPHGMLATATGILLILAFILWIASAVHSTERYSDCARQHCAVGEPMLLNGRCFCLQPAVAVQVKQ